MPESILIFYLIPVVPQGVIFGSVKTIWPLKRGLISVKLMGSESCEIEGRWPNSAIDELRARFSGLIAFTQTDSNTDLAIDIDYLGEVVATHKRIGIQIKPTSIETQLAGFSREGHANDRLAEIEKVNNMRVFIVVVMARDKKRVIVNLQVIEEIESYIREK